MPEPTAVPAAEVAHNEVPPVTPDLAHDTTPQLSTESFPAAAAHMDDVSTPPPAPPSIAPSPFTPTPALSASPDTTVATAEPFVPHETSPVTTPQPLTPPIGPTPAGVHPFNTVAIPSAMPHPKSRAKAVIKFMAITLLLLLVVGSGGAIAAYRVFPHAFFQYVPATLSSRLNALWPLHKQFSDMLSADTAFFATVNYSVDNTQSTQLKQLIERIPGLTNAQNGFKKDIDQFFKDHYNLSFDQDIKTTFGETVYLAVPQALDNGPHYLAISITDPQKAAQLLQNVQSNQQTKLVYAQEQYNGVTLFVLQPDSATIPGRGRLIQAMNHLPSSTPVVAKQSSSCNSRFKVCADTAVDGATNPNEYPTVAVMDNFLIFANAQKQMKTLVDQVHSRKPTLAHNSSYSSVEQSNQSLASLYVNIEKALHDFQTASPDSSVDLVTEYKGYKAWGGNISAESSGFVLKGSLHYDTAVLKPAASKILQAKDTDSIYTTLLPDSTAIIDEESELGTKLQQIAETKQGGTTFDDSFTQQMGVKLSDLAAQFSGRYAFSFLPQSKAAVVMQAEVSNSETLNTQLQAMEPRVAQYLSQILGMTVDVTTDASSGNTVHSLVVHFPQIPGYPTIPEDYFALSYAVANNRFVLATNKSGVTAGLQTAPSALATHPRLIEDLKVVGAQNRLMFHLNTKKTYHGIIDAIRAITNNPNLSTSDQEAVIDAYLDVFPSLTAASHMSRNLNHGFMTIPVVALDATRQKQIETIMQTNPSGVYDITPFINPLGVSAVAPPPSTSSTPPAAETIDLRDELRVEGITAIAEVIEEDSLDIGNYNAYKTSGAEKLDPATGIMKKLIDKQLIKADAVDPNWPEFYYTFESDGTFIRVTALTEQKFDEPDNCQPPKEIRGRWTFCVDKL